MALCPDRPLMSEYAGINLYVNLGGVLSEFRNVCVGLLFTRVSVSVNQGSEQSAGSDYHYPQCYWVFQY
jgi:hypothetical protein